MSVGIHSIVEALDWTADHSKEVVAVMYAYFDDSGTDDAAKTAVMAGYVAHAADWKKFETKTKALFDKSGVPFFRAKMFDHGQKHFNGWSDRRKFGFAKKWYDYAGRYLLRGVSAGMLKQDFKAAKAKDPKLPGISCSAYCLQMAIRHLIQDAEVWGEIGKYGLHFVIESSATADGGIRDDFHRMLQANPELGAYLKSITFVHKQSVRGIQLADYLAYYSQRLAERAIDDSLDGVTPYLDLAKANVRTIFRLGYQFGTNPEYRAALRQGKRVLASR